MTAASCCDAAGARQLARQQQLAPGLAPPLVSLALPALLLAAAGARWRRPCRCQAAGLGLHTSKAAEGSGACACLCVHHLPLRTAHRRSSKQARAGAPVMLTADCHTAPSSWRLPSSAAHVTMAASVGALAVGGRPGPHPSALPNQSVALGRPGWELPRVHLTKLSTICGGRVMGEHARLGPPLLAARPAHCACDCSLSPAHYYCTGMPATRLLMARSCLEDLQRDVEAGLLASRQHAELAEVAVVQLPAAP